MPYQPNGRKAAVDDPATWSSYPEACASVGQVGNDGVGIVLTDEDDLIAFDLDDCRDPATGALDDQARAIVDSLDSYTEVTPSERGLRVLVRGHLPPGGRRNAQRGVEVYESGRYVTITGQHVVGTPTTIEHRQAEVEAAHRELFGTVRPPAGTAQPVDLDDAALLDKMFTAANGGKVERLYRGDLTGYGSQSEADLALCDHLAFWTGKDPKRMDRIYRLSALYRAKWDEPHYSDGSTYGQKTIERAVSGTAEVYQPPTGLLGPVRLNGAAQRDGAPSTGGEERAGAPWPTLHDDALHGPAGEFVRAVGPETEADPVALLLSFLTACGNAIGTGVWCEVGTQRHHFRIWPVLVGATAKGRKGTSLAPVRAVFALADPTWHQTRVVSGLSSGEGLIWAVRDPIQAVQRERKDGEVRYVLRTTDHGVSDKRLMVVEPEFASVLKVASREGNTLSPIVRQAWDDGALSSLTKNSPASATGAHITILGHVTADELRRHLTETEAGNGFGNRFLWVCVRRSKYLPEGGSLAKTVLDQLGSTVKDVLDFGRQAGVLVRDEGARTLWRKVYPVLSDGRTGLLGAMCSRAEAQVLRLSGLYALLDRSRVITVDHLKAALAVWDYCEASARWIFGDSLGDPLGDTILGALRRQAEMTRTDITNLLGKNHAAPRIEAALRVLEANGLAARRRRPTDGAGRPAEIWSIST